MGTRISRHKFSVFQDPHNSFNAENVLRAHVIANPCAGGGTGSQFVNEVRVELKLMKLDVVVHMTEYSGHAFKIILGIAFTDGDFIVSVGGDGTLHEVANGLLNRFPGGVTIPLLIVPCGSGNSVAYDLCILNLRDSLVRLQNRRCRKIDVMEVFSLEADIERRGSDLAPINIFSILQKKRLFCINMIGWGFSVTSTIRANELRWLGRGAQYTIGGFDLVLRRGVKGASAYFSVPNHSVHNGKTLNDFVIVQAQLTCHVGDKIANCPKAKLDDGLIDVIAVKPTSRLQLGILFNDAKKGNHLSHPSVEYFQVTEFSLIPSKTASSVESPVGSHGKTLINVDGEIMEIGSIKVQCLPLRIKVFC